MILEIPFPPRTLHPNARVHWAVLAKAKKKHRSDCYLLAKQKRVVFHTQQIPILIRWHPKTAHSFDADNAIASLKGALDGIAEAWGVDDSRFVLSFEKMPPVKDGKVFIVIQERQTEYPSAPKPIKL